MPARWVPGPPHPLGSSAPQNLPSTFLLHTAMYAPPHWSLSLGESGGGWAAFLSVPMANSGSSFIPGFGVTQSRGPQAASTMARSQQLGLLTFNDLFCLSLSPHLGPCQLSCYLRHVYQCPFTGFPPPPPFQLFPLDPATHSCFVCQILFRPPLCARC